MVVYKLSLGEHVYFGIAKNIDARLRRHRNDLAKGKHHNPILQRAYNKGYSVTHSILFENLIREEANEIEKRLITENKCVNMTKGGDGGDTVSNHPNILAIREKQRIASKNLPKSKEFIASQGRMAEYAEALWGPYYCEYCQKDIRGKSNFNRHQRKCKLHGTSKSGASGANKTISKK